jgi:hypothetical protein
VLRQGLAEPRCAPDRPRYAIGPIHEVFGKAFTDRGRQEYSKFRTMASPSIRRGMASRRGETTRRQMANRFGKEPPASRHRKCRPMSRSIRPKRATTDPGNQCGPGKQTRSESHLPLLLQRSSAPVRLLTLGQVRMRVDGRAVRLDTIREVLESILRDVPRRDDDVLVRRMVTAR